jgi:uncharacterized protein (TIGR02996 family)
MDDGEELRAAIRQAPEDWQSWRVYGDWLLEQGDIRGELIELEHQMATQALAPEREDALWRRARAIEAEHREQWLGGWTLPAEAILHWRNGFVTGAWLPWGEQTLVVLGELLARPVAFPFSWLDLSENEGNERVHELTRQLVESPLLRGLRRLDLGFDGLQDEDFHALATCPFLHELTELELGMNQLGPECARSLARSPSLRSLVRLSLGANPLRDEGVAVLAECASLCKLVELDLRHTLLGPEGAAALASSQTLPALARLILRENDGLGDEGARALARSTSLRGLTFLDLEASGVGPEGAAALAASESLRGCLVLG